MAGPSKLSCPFAKYNSQMHIDCTKRGEMCAHQRWKPCKGWCVLTDQAAVCPGRKDEVKNEKRKTVKKRRN